MQRELISNVLQERFNELCGVRLPGFAPEAFGEMAGIVSLIQKRLHGALPSDLKNSSPDLNVPSEWMESDTDFLVSLQTLCLGQILQHRSGGQPQFDPFLTSLDECRSDAERRFQLLAERYICPLNFTLLDENEVREYILMRLMVQDRALIEATSIDAVNSADLLLRLNLVAVHAGLTPDLRFLDSLNYYYELLPAAWLPAGQHNWLFVSYLALYANALAARI